MNPNRHLLKLSSLLVLLLFLAACGGTDDTVTPTPPNPQPQPVIPPTPTPPTEPGGNTISGTVTGPGDVTNTVIIACLNADCESSQPAVAQTDVAGNYVLSNLTPGSYQILAIKDVDGNGDFNNGDYVGAYPSLQAPTAVTPPATGINIAMQVFDDGTGGGTPPPPTTPPGGSGISGTVTSASGDVANTVVLACPFAGTEPDCDSALSAVVTQPGPSAAYSIDNTSASQYAVISLQDVNGDPEFDYLGIYGGQNLTPVTPPASGIDIQLQAASPASLNSFNALETRALDIEANLDKIQSLFE